MNFPAIAAFISRDSASAPQGAAPYFRGEIDVEPGFVRATLAVSALGIVVPHLNGRRIGDAVLAPGWTSYRHYLDVLSWDVTEALRVGTNVLGAIVGEGWAVGPLTWENTPHNWADRVALFLQLEVEYPDRSLTFGTDASFRSAFGAIRSNGLYCGEHFDAREDPIGWDEVGFDDSAWDPVQVYDWDSRTLRAQLAPPIRRIEERAPIDIRTNPDGATIVDFGQNLSGWVRLRAAGSSGDVISLRFAEVLTPSGELEPETNRSAAASDSYTLRGERPETWEPAFTFHGFRYVQVDGWPGEVTADSLTAVVVHSDMRRTGWFETSNPLLTRLHQNAVWSMRSNFVGLPTDCPQRDERLGWTGDINAFGPTATFLYRVKEVLGSWLADLAAEQKEYGGVPWVVPDVLSSAGTPTALWGDVAVNLPWELYQEYGDLQALRACYRSAKAHVLQVRGLLDERGLWSTGFQFGDWLDPAAPPDDPAGGLTDRYLVANAFLYRSTSQLARIAELLGKSGDAAEFSALAGRIRGAFAHEYVTPAGRLTNETATAYSLAIVLGLLDASQLARAGGRLAELLAEGDYATPTGFAGTPFVLDALSSTGHTDVAFRLLLRMAPPSFLYPVTMGATTTWERWDSVLPDGTLNSTGMTSLNHYAFGAVCDWLHRVVGGLQRVEPGWSHIRIAPQPGGGLTSVHTMHDSSRGRVEVAWAIENGELRLDAVVPHGAKATVVLPWHPESGEVEVGAGHHHWRYAIDAALLAPPPFTMMSTLAEIATDDRAWEAIRVVLERRFPTLDLTSPESSFASRPLGALLARFPDPGGEFERELRDALEL